MRVTNADELGKLTRELKACVGEQPENVLVVVEMTKKELVQMEEDIKDDENLLTLDAPNFSERDAFAYEADNGIKLIIKNIR